MKRAHVVLTLILMTLLIPAVTVSAQDAPGILGQKAPSWTVDNWFNLVDLLRKNSSVKR